MTVGENVGELTEPGPGHGSATVAICALAQNRFGPRPVRAAQLENELSTRFTVDRWPSGELPGVPQQPSALKRRLSASVRYLSEAVILDRYEPAMRKASGRLRQIDPAAGLLIGAPYSPCVIAAEILQKLDRPYVVDLGDPWVLTGSNPTRRLLGGARQRRAERRLWAGSAGAILTTEQQAEDIAALFPNLEIMVRPNGYLPVDRGQAQPVERKRSRVLRLVHYGTLYGTRLDPVPAFKRLANSGRWDRIELVQYGLDWSGALDGLSDFVSVEIRPERPWAELVPAAGEFDAAIVVGFGEANKWQLPSKAIQYLTLPIPRLAIGCAHDAALCQYTRDKPGYLTVTAAQEDLPELLEAHLARPWNSADLAPPEAEAWPVVAGRLADFFLERVGLA